MDNWRGHFPDRDEAYGDTRDFNVDDDESGDELPPVVIGQDERRMQVRAYNFWTGLLGDRNFPSANQLDPENLPDFGPHSVLLDFTQDIQNPEIAYLGEKLAQECGTDGEIAHLSDVPSRSLLSRITDHYLQIIANQAPIGFEAEFVNQRGNTILYRGILLPFSSDNQTIDFIYGVINWKQLADQETADELLLEIDQALAPRRSERHKHLPMTSWADGPVDYGIGYSVDYSSVLDLTQAISCPVDELPSPSFPDVPLPLEAHTDEDTPLADLLACARSFADEAKACQARTRHALYTAIGLAYDCSLAAAREPEAFRELVQNAGLKVSARQPMVPVVKLVFGSDYDKTRLAEFAAVLDHAHRLGLGIGELAGHLGSVSGGLKAVLAEERRLRRAENGTAGKRSARTAPSEEIARKLRGLESHSFDAVPADGSEFTLLVARRAPDGEVVLLGEVSQDIPLIERAARHLLG